MTKEDLIKLAEDKELMEVARLAVEDFLIDLRDSRISILNRRNGLVVYEKDGSPSHIIRIGIEGAIAIGLKAIADSLENKDEEQE